MKSVDSSLMSGVSRYIILIMLCLMSVVPAIANAASTNIVPILMLLLDDECSSEGPLVVTAAIQGESAGVISNTMGSISPATRMVKTGCSTSFTVSTNEGYGVDTVSGCPGSLSGSTFSAGPITQNCTLTASFAHAYTVTATAALGGVVSPSSVNVIQNRTTNISISPNEGYAIANVSGCGGTLQGSTFTTGPVTAACPVSATFNRVITITATSGSGGAISPSGSFTKAKNTTQTFTLSPVSGYGISSVSGCGGVWTPGSTSYTTDSIEEDCSVTATFGLNYTVTAIAGQGGTVSSSSQTVVSGNKATFEVTPSSETGYDWSATGNMNYPRSSHTANMLESGKVIVTGGTSSDGKTTRTEIYDPATMLWATARSMSAPRSSHTATKLNNNKLVVVGGESDGDVTLDTAELYDPVANTWATVVARLNGTRKQHTATLLESGKVLVAGGRNGDTRLASSEIFNPDTEIWETTNNSLATARDAHTATRLANNKVLVVGGTSNGINTLNSAEIYDPVANSWQTVVDAMNGSRKFHTATLLADGRVLVAGGTNGTSVWKTARIFDPSGNSGMGSWTSTGALEFERYGHTATLLTNGEVLVVGGQSDSSRHSTAELYNPTSGTWTAADSMETARSSHTVTELPDGALLAVGGQGSSGVLASAELYDPWVYAIRSVTGNCGGSLAGYTYTTDSISGNCSITAAFQKVHKVLSSVPGGNGWIDPPEVHAPDNAIEVFNLTAAAGYLLDGSVTGTCGGSLSAVENSTNTWRYTTAPIRRSCEMIANYVAYGSAPSYAITTNAGANGSISPAARTVKQSQSTSFTITPQSGYMVDSASGCGNSLIGNTSTGAIAYTAGPVMENCTVTATFKQSLPSYAVSSEVQTNGVIASTGGSITLSSNSVVQGGTTTFTVNKNTGYAIGDVIGTGCDVSLVSGTQYTTGPITQACKVTAKFLKIYTVTATPGPNGTVTPSTRTVNHGQTTTFTVIPNSGHAASMSSTCVGGAGTLSGTGYTTKSITSDCTVAASFVASVDTIGRGLWIPPSALENPISNSNLVVADHSSSPAHPTQTYIPGCLNGLSSAYPTSGCAVNSSFTDRPDGLDQDYTVTMNLNKTLSLRYMSKSVISGNKEIKLTSDDGRSELSGSLSLWITEDPTRSYESTDEACKKTATSSLKVVTGVSSGCIISPNTKYYLNIRSNFSCNTCRYIFVTKLSDFE